MPEEPICTCTEDNLDPNCPLVLDLLREEQVGDATQPSLFDLPAMPNQHTEE